MPFGFTEWFRMGEHARTDEGQAFGGGLELGPVEALHEEPQREQQHPGGEPLGDQVAVAHSVFA
jgi:hypothetical protein